MPVPLSLLSTFTFTDSTGTPLASGKVTGYMAGTTTPLDLYTGPGGEGPSSFITLNASGQASIWLAPGYLYTLIVQDSDSNVIYTLDYIGTLNYIGNANVTVEDFGGAVNTDCTAAINAAKAAGVTVLEFPGSYYKINGQVDHTGMILQGAGAGTTLDCSAATVLYPLTAQGSIEPIAAEIASFGVQSIVFNASPGVVTGDVINLWDSTENTFSGFRTNYYAGEWCEVLTVVPVSDTYVVNLKSPLYGTYMLESTLKAYVLASSSPSGIRRCTIQNNNGLVNDSNIAMASMLQNPIYEEVTIVGGKLSGLLIDRCYGGKIINCDSIGPPYTPAPGVDPYCILISNSQDIRITGGQHFCGWQPISFGGGAPTSDYGYVPSRNCIVDGCTLRNDPLSLVATADMHGNCQDIVYVNCTIFGGATWSGAGGGYDNCIIYGNAVQNPNPGTPPPSTVGGACVISAELLGGTYFLRNCKVITFLDPSSSGYGVIDVGANNSNNICAYTVYDCHFIVENTQFILNGTTSSTVLFSLKNDGGGTHNVNVKISDISIATPSQQTILFMSFNTDTLGGSVASKYIVVDNISCTTSGMTLADLDANYIGFNLRMQRQSGLVPGLATVAWSNSVVTPAQTFNFSYPRYPRVGQSIVSQGGSTFPTFGGVTAVANTHEVTSTSVTLIAQAATGVFGATPQSFEMHWWAEISEC
jgi:hypothetical protein